MWSHILEPNVVMRWVWTNPFGLHHFQEMFLWQDIPVAIVTMVRRHCNKKHMFLKQRMQPQRQHDRNCRAKETLVFAEVKREHRRANHMLPNWNSWIFHDQKLTGTRTSNSGHQLGVHNWHQKCKMWGGCKTFVNDNEHSWHDFDHTDQPNRADCWLCCFQGVDSERLFQSSRFLKHREMMSTDNLQQWTSNCHAWCDCVHGASVSKTGSSLGYTREEAISNMSSIHVHTAASSS